MFYVKITLPMKSSTTSKWGPASPIFTLLIKTYSCTFFSKTIVDRDLKLYVLKISMKMNLVHSVQLLTFSVLVRFYILSFNSCVEENLQMLIKCMCCEVKNVQFNFNRI